MPITPKPQQTVVLLKQTATASTPSAPSIDQPMATLPPTNLAKYRLVCPKVPVYSSATRSGYESRGSGVRRTAYYVTDDSAPTVRKWFQHQLQPPEWTLEAESPEELSFINRQADEYNPGIGLLITFEPLVTAQTRYHVTLIIGHPHRQDNWCPGLEP
jgi:hypothetical protein